MRCCRAAPLTYNENWCQQKSRLAHRCRGKAQRVASRRPPSHHEQLAAPGHRGGGGWRRRPRASVVRRQPQRRRCPRPARPHRWCRRGRRLVRAALSLGLHDHLPHGGLRERQLHMRRVRCSEAHQPAIREPLLRGHLRRPTDQPDKRVSGSTRRGWWKLTATTSFSRSSSVPGRWGNDAMHVAMYRIPGSTSSSWRCPASAVDSSASLGDRPLTAAAAVAEGGGTASSSACQQQHNERMEWVQGAIACCAPAPALQPPATPRPEGCGSPCPCRLATTASRCCCRSPAPPPPPHGSPPARVCKQPHRLRIADEGKTAEGQVHTISAVWSMWRCSHVASACLHSSTDASSVFCSVRSCSFPASSP